MQGLRKLYKGHSLELIISLTKSLMKSRYRKTIAGVFWVMLNPILTFLIQALIFKNILKVAVDDYYLFLLSGAVPWIFLTTTMNMTVSSFVVNRPNLMAFKIDPWIFIVSQTIDNFITYIISFTFLLCLNGDIAVIYGAKLPLFIFTSLIFLAGTYFLSFLFAIIHAYYRDTQFILTFVLNLAYFVTPIFYPKELIPEGYRWLVTYNPFFLMIKPFQSIFWRYDLELYTHDVAVSSGLIVILMAVTLLYWGKKKHGLYFRI